MVSAFSLVRDDVFLREVFYSYRNVTHEVRESRRGSRKSGAVTRCRTKTISDES